MNHFLKELQRRNVVKVALAYLAVAWLVIQLVGEIGPILNLPEWIPRVVLGLLGVGFVIATALAWIYEITNKGLRRTEDVDRDASIKSLHGRTLDFVIIGALLLALVYFVWESRFAQIPDTSKAVESVAVMPFRDLSEGRDQAYFAEGISEELLNALSRVPDLKVAGRSSSFSLRDEQEDSVKVAGILGVSHLLQGSVRTSGQQLRVSAQLINGKDGFQVWSRVFDGGIEEVFQVQDQIAELVINALSQQLDSAGVESSFSTPTTSPEAYSAYLLGRYSLAQRTGEHLQQAANHFRTVIDMDPAYSPAISGLAKTLTISPYYVALASPVELFSEAGTLAHNAIELDPDNSEAYSVLGMIAMIFHRDWQQAHDYFLKSVELHPNSAGNLNLYGDYLFNVGDYQEALLIEGQAAELEPLSAVFQHELAIVHAFLGNYDQAIRLEQLAVQLSPDFTNAWGLLARMYAASGQEDKTFALLESKNMSLSGPLRIQIAVTRAYRAGNEQEIERLMSELVELVEQGKASMTIIAYIYARLGDDENASYWVERAYLERDPILISPIYFFLPEDWPALPKTQGFLSKPDLEQLYELRRQYISEGKGRVSSFDHAL